MIQLRLLRFCVALRLIKPEIQDEIEPYGKEALFPFDKPSDEGEWNYEESLRGLLIVLPLQHNIALVSLWYYYNILDIILCHLIADLFFPLNPGIIQLNQHNMIAWLLFLL